jgi:hypothetical protein
MEHRRRTSDAPPTQQPEHRGPVSVGTYATRMEAEIIRAHLDSAGIAAWLATDDAGGAYPFDLSGGAQVLVAAQDFAAASAILGAAPGER